MPPNVNHRFLVDGQGRLHETSVSESVARLHDTFPEVDMSAFEAETMLERTHRLLALMRDTEWSQFGLTGSRFILLRLLYVSPSKRLTMSEIAAHMNLGQNGATQLVDAMCDAGLVRREPGGEDRRVIYAGLTPKGSSLFERVLPLTAQRVERVWAPLTRNEREVMRHLLAKVRMHLLATEGLLEEDHSSDTGRARPKRGSAKGRVQKPIDS